MLGYGEVVGGRLYAMLIRVLDDDKLLGVADHARLHLEYDRLSFGDDFRTISC